MLTLYPATLLNLLVLWVFSGFFRGFIYYIPSMNRNNFTFLVDLNIFYFFFLPHCSVHIFLYGVSINKFLELFLFLIFQSFNLYTIMTKRPQYYSIRIFWIWLYSYLYQYIFFSYVYSMSSPSHCCCHFWKIFLKFTSQYYI